MDILHYSLTEDDSSWVDVFMLPENLIPNEEQFSELWNLHPENKGNIVLMGKTIPTPRWFQSFGHSYSFSGIKHESKPIPEIVQKYLDYANSFSVEYFGNYGNHVFNMCLMNWYQDGNDYIGYHADSDIQLHKTTKGEVLVFSISFGIERLFYLKSNETGEVTKIPMPNGSVLIMGGLCQKTHKHSVPKISTKKISKPRINLTFRMFK